MTRKHYERVAKIIAVQIIAARARGPLAEQTAREIALDFAKFAAEERPEFNTERFLKACGI